MCLIGRCIWLLVLFIQVARTLSVGGRDQSAPPPPPPHPAHSYLSPSPNMKTDVSPQIPSSTRNPYSANYPYSDNPSPSPTHPLILYNTPTVGRGGGMIQVGWMNAPCFQGLFYPVVTYDYCTNMNYPDGWVNPGVCQPPHQGSPLSQCSPAPFHPPGHVTYVWSGDSWGEGSTWASHLNFHWIWGTTSSGLANPISFKD